MTKKGRTMEEALAILEEMSGKSLSPDLVEAFIAEIREGGMF